MAHKAESFKVDAAKKTIIIYTNCTADPAEEVLIERYLKLGFTPKFAEKKPSKSVDDMRAEMLGDKEALAAFNEAYKDKKGGFFKACKIYAEWKKRQK